MLRQVVRSTCAKLMDVNLVILHGQCNLINEIVFIPIMVTSKIAHSEFCACLFGIPVISTRPSCGALRFQRDVL